VHSGTLAQASAVTPQRMGRELLLNHVLDLSCSPAGQHGDPPKPGVMQGEAPVFCGERGAGAFPLGD